MHLEEKKKREEYYRCELVLYISLFGGLVDDA